MVISEPSSCVIFCMCARLLPYISDGRLLLLGWRECRGVACWLRLAMVGCRLARANFVMDIIYIKDLAICSEKISIIWSGNYYNGGPCSNLAWCWYHLHIHTNSSIQHDTCTMLQHTMQSLVQFLQQHPTAYHIHVTKASAMLLCSIRAGGVEESCSYRIQHTRRFLSPLLLFHKAVNR